jgi:hypothetical protein
LLEVVPRANPTWIVADHKERVEKRPVGRAAMAAMVDPKAKAGEVARRLGITTTTLFAYVNGDGAVKQAGQALFDRP